MAKLLIPGRVSPTSPSFAANEFLEITKTYEIIPRTRDGKSKVTGVDTTLDEVLSLQFEDGGEWIGSVSDLEEIFGKPLKNSKGEIELPDGVRALNAPANRAGTDDFKMEVVEFVKSKLTNQLKKTAIHEITFELGKLADQHIMPDPGLFRVKGNEIKVFKEDPNTPQHYLLFLHGTVSSYHGSFDGLFEDDSTGVSDAIPRIYKNNVIALQHYTLTESPFKNAIQVLEKLPKGSTLDIISHSRGGIIADILATCDKTTLTAYSESYTAADIVAARKKENGYPNLADELIKLNKLAATKQIEVKKIIRIASPAAGTVILDNRFEKYLNTILGAMGKIPTLKALPLYQFCRALVTAVCEIKALAEHLPGLVAMIPQSFLQKLVNKAEISLKSKLMVIEGDAEFGGKLGHSTSVIITNVLFREDNDFVVNTCSMSRGMLREGGVQILTSKDTKTSHFAYFRNKNTQQGIVDALNNTGDITVKGFTLISNDELAQRGSIVGLFKKYKHFKSDTITGTKPVIILIPGIMGTHLSVNGNVIWADLIEIGKGRMFHLDPVANPTVGTDYVIGQYYADLVDYLSDEYEVLTFGYDWRSSLSVAAKNLNDTLQILSTHNKPIRIIAHSMGGLVVRDLMRLHSVDWKKYIVKPESKLILLGTPWRGSHLIVEAFTGHLKVVRQINFMDLGHSPQQLLDLYHSFEGMYQLLPLVENWESKKKWDDLKVELMHEKFNVPKLLKQFGEYKDVVNAWYDKLDKKDYNQIYYIAGKSDCTTTACEVINKKLKYFGTPEGDGSVTWELGIPEKLPSERIYYAHDTEHGDLASDTRLFKGIREILTKGLATTGNNLYPTPPATLAQRGTKTIEKQEGLVPVIYEPVSNRAEESWNNLLNKKQPKTKRDGAKDPIEVAVIHGDMRYASYPVMAGHILHEGITGAEYVLDGFFEGKLSERFEVGNYPGLVGDSLVLFDPHLKPKGTIILGLGKVNEFNAYQLRKAVEAGVINYAMHLRDNVNNKWLDDDVDLDRDILETSLTTLCIGTGYGRIAMDDALSAILTGVQKANEIIVGLNTDLKPIQRLEFVELYEHIAQNMYYQLSMIKARNNNKINIKLKKGIEPKYGARKKFQFANDSAWWHNFSTEHDESKETPRIKFISSSGIARVEEENTFTSMKEVTSILKDLAIYDQWDEDAAKTLFELLIPYNLKDIIRQQNNILWKMDLDTASIPWEMFHDKDQDKEPTFINAGLIRQLITPNARNRPNIIRSNTALVIGDPDYSGSDLPDLPGAKAEAEDVHTLLLKYNFSTNALIQKNKKTEILKHLTTKEYKILHIAGHGQVEKGKTGVVLNDGFILSAEKFKNFSRIPEFAFINCCSLGAIIPDREKYYENRYQFAANLGTELINLGVNAVVVAGWPVDDTAARKFAQVLYENLLAGVLFGAAVQRARKEAYTLDNNTWGAYQCYGDPWYQLAKPKSRSESNAEYIAQDEVLADLYNLVNQTKLPDFKKEARVNIKEKLNAIVKRAEDHNLYASIVQEKEAEILSELNELDDAITRLQNLRGINKADYSIRSVEQYYSLRMKKLLKIKLKPSEKTKLESLAEEMNAMEQDFLTLLTFGDTAERFSLIGSTYKKLASLRHKTRGLSAKVRTKAKYLAMAKDYYEKAYLHKDLSTQAQKVYPLSNLLALHAIISGASTIVLDHKEENILAFIDKKIKDLKGSFPKHEDFWDDISIINLLQAKLYYVSSRQLKTTIDEIIKYYKAARKTGGCTQKNLQTEIEQCELMLDFDVKGRSPGWMVEFRKGVERVMGALEGMR